MNLEATRSDILDSFAAESAVSMSTLLTYLNHYPHYASDLLELYETLNRIYYDTEELSAEDRHRIDQAWAMFKKSLAFSAHYGVSPEDIRRHFDQ